MRYDAAAGSAIFQPFSATFSRFSADVGHVPPHRPLAIPWPDLAPEVPMAHARPSSPLDPLDRLIGEAPTLQTLRAQIRHLAHFDAVGHAAVPTVLLQGETGTGKGLVARVIHDSGARAPGPFIEVNCAAIPETLLEAELFGVEAGAFTDAKRAKPGLFESASGGTLFLDEIAALPLTLQGKCLTAIEAKRVRRVGAVVEHPLPEHFAADRGGPGLCLCASGTPH
jgi:transcriptional regulator with AAA-type ATPase domain